ncbi:hypothetical protein ASE15_03320 [Oerskovia sp. Root22]|nr:hypothetical protein ASE15_03320 [Oerskovia sp. Root22]
MRHVVAVIDRCLAATPQWEGVRLVEQLSQICEECFTLVDESCPGEEFNTGVALAASDLYIALNTWPSPYFCGEVLDAPLDARTAVRLGGAQ